MATGGKMISMKKLPVGHRLNPSDEDLVNHHLHRKLLNIEEEYCSIPEFDIYKVPPWDLITKYNELSDLASDGRECFFYHRPASTKRNNRRTKEKEGFWKCTGKGMKSKETDQTKWHKRYLVYYLGTQKSAEETNWAMHEYVNLADPRIVVCRIHKKEPKKGKKKVDSVSSESGPNGSPRARTCSEIKNQPLETSPEASVNTTMASVHKTTESQNPTLTSNSNMAEFRMSSPKQMQTVAEERSSPYEYPYTDFIQLTDLEDPHDPCIFTREQAPRWENTFINECDREDDSRLSLGHTTNEIQNQPLEISPEASVNTTMASVHKTTESQNPTLTSNSNMAEFRMSSPKQMQIVAEEGSSPSEYPYTDFIQLTDLEDQHDSMDLDDPHDSCIFTREQSPCCENAFINECDREDDSRLSLGHTTREDSADIISPPQPVADQSLNDVVLGFISPPQQNMTPTEDICTLVGDTSFKVTGSGSGMIYPQQDIQCHGAQFARDYMKYGAQETNFKEASQSTLNPQTPVSSPNSDFLSPEDIEWLDSLLVPPPPTNASGGTFPESNPKTSTGY